MTTPHADAAKLKIVATSEVELPAGRAFDAFTDVDRFEMMARRRGAKIRRHGGSNDPLTDVSWDVETTIRRKTRNFQVYISEIDAPGLIVYQMVSKQYEASARIYFLPVEDHASRVRVELRANPKTIAARIVLHSMRLSKNRIRRRMERGLKLYCQSIESRQSTPMRDILTGS